MRNWHYEVKGDKLIMTVSLSTPGVPSKSGNTLVIGSTEGNARIHIPNLGTVSVGGNIYRDPKTETEIKDCLAAKQAQAARSAAGL